MAHTQACVFASYRWAIIKWVPNADAPWGAVAWFPHQRHGWGLIQWPTMSGRVSSMDRLKAWGVIQANDCPEQWTRVNNLIATYNLLVHLLLEDGGETGLL